ncbi:hypothetical protein, partial [Mycobacterium avium]|uniref:hypothetical protein n=2 Tax=Mycobacterium avium TaxID=1764 RepID=UPI00111C01B9
MAIFPSPGKRSLDQSGPARPTAGLVAITGNSRGHTRNRSKPVAAGRARVTFYRTDDPSHARAGGQTMLATIQTAATTQPAAATQSAFDDRIEGRLGHVPWS